MVIPTGINCAIGGHAGDAGAMARLFASVCDTLILHPNVVNASDINELPDNALYVEGSTLDRFFRGEIGLQPVHGNRILAVIQEHEDEEITSLAVNTVNAARATWGCPISEIVTLTEAPKLTATVDELTGAIHSTLTGIARLFEVLRDGRQPYDALAITSVVQVPPAYHGRYFRGDLPLNPWGAAEAKLSKIVSDEFNIPCAHAPMIEDYELLDEVCGIVDARKAAEAISCGFFHCCLKGLANAPRIVETTERHCLTVEDVDALVIPYSCSTSTVLDADHLGIPIIAIKENTNLAQTGHDMIDYEADNALDAAGILAALKAGIDPRTTRRPIQTMTPTRL
jgi:hypothetical protein